MAVSPGDGSDLGPALEALRAAQTRDGCLSIKDRRSSLKAVRAHLVSSAEDYADAANRDFGRRSRHETLLAEVSIAIGAIDHALPRLERWCRPTRVHVGLPFWPARVHLLKQPRGIVGIISPSNYPLQLSIVPLVGALSAGCRAIVKLSDVTPHVSNLIASGLGAVLDKTVASIVTGGPEVGASLSREPLDLLVFTGSALGGKAVLAAAAATGTPVVLELGGKSPAILDISADLDRAAEAIVAGKLINAGQTCVAPDYLLVPHQMTDMAVEALRRQAARLFPTSSDLTAVLSTQASDRIERLAAGQRTVELLPFSVEPPLVTPRLVLRPDLDSAIMREEIFGPLLPIVAYDNLEHALDIINARPEPLALYWFGDTRERFAMVAARTRTGAVAVEDTVIHAGIHEIPFGGIGASGIGRYHGKAGFDTFTHERPVFRQARYNLPRLLRPPYGKFADRILARLIR